MAKPSLSEQRKSLNSSVVRPTLFSLAFKANLYKLCSFFILYIYKGRGRTNNNMNKKQILPKTTKHTNYILYLLYRFRFLTTQHVQYFMNHKLPTRIRSWMKRLYKDGYIDRYHSNETFEKNSQPAIYWLTSKAKYILKENTDCDPYILDQLYKEKTILEPFRNHCIFLAEITIKLETEYKKENTKFDYFTQRELSGYMHFPQPLPDAFIEIKKLKRKTKRYFLELFDNGIPRYAMRARIDRYFRSAENVEWEKQTHVSFPIILLICANMQTKRFLNRFIEEKLEEEYIELSFSVLTQDEVKCNNLETIIK